MRTLNLRKVRWIVREMHKGQLSTRHIAKQQGITPQHARRLYRKYKDVPLYKLNREICLKPCGRKPGLIDETERKLILDFYNKLPICAVKIEKYHETFELPRVPHNRIQRILSEAGLVKHIDKKIRRRKWVRYEREYSNELWHTDFTEDDQGKQIMAYIDDASRKVVGKGKFDNATTENALSTLDNAIKKHGKPVEVMTDHGSQFCTDEEKVFKFREELTKRGIKHIMAAVKRPQSNGKIERWFGSTEKLYYHFGRDLDKTVECYNKLPHLSLDTTPEVAYLERMGKG
jgi:putative transposase